MGVDAAAQFGKANFAMSHGWEPSPALKALMVLGLVLGLAAPGIGAFGGGRSSGATWPWHLAWIGFGLVCLGAGLWVRQRRDAARAAKAGGQAG